MNRPPFLCLHELVTNRVSNQTRGRVYVELAHGSRPMRLRRLDAEIEDRAHVLVAVPLRDQLDEILCVIADIERANDIRAMGGRR